MDGGNAMKSKFICFASSKGGTGKTVVSASLGIFLASIGKKVLLVDMDAATNGLSLLYLEELVNAKKLLAKKNISARGIFEITENEMPTPFSIDKSIDFIPAMFTMKKVEGISEEIFRRIVSETLSAFQDEYDYVLIDAQAGSDIYSEIAIENADEIVIVSEYDPVSVEGVERLKRLFPEALTPDKTWILFNKILPEIVKPLGDFLSISRYISPIPWDVEVIRAFSRRKLAIDMEKGNDYTLAIMRTALSLLGNEIKEEVNSWRQTKEALIREPVRKQLEDLEIRMAVAERARIEIAYELKDYQRKSRRFLLNTTMMLTSIMLAIIVLLDLFAFALLTEILLPAISIFMLIGLSGIIYVRNRIERSSREKQKELERQFDMLNRELADIDERRRKYMTMVESDLETLLKKREY